MIVNWTIPLEAFVAKANSDTHLIFSDGDHVNSGVFFIRNRPRSIQFLDRWWKYGNNHFQYQYDQGPLSWLILDMVKEQTKARYSGGHFHSFYVENDTVRGVIP